jgi:predicted regulator of Ras-like GTPase activity (Roadblock/LC7/MglB family)
VGAFERATRVTEPSLHADLRQAESARFSGRMLAFVGADQIGGAVFSEGRVGWAIHRAQAENLGTFLERLGRVGRAQLGEIRRTYEASDKRQSFATVLEQAQLVPQPIFRRCLLLHNRCALAELSRAPVLRLERRPGAGAGEKAMLFALGELMTEIAPEPSAADRVERWRTLDDENRPLAPLAEVPGFRAAAALNAEGQVVAAYAPRGVPDAGVLASTLAGLVEAAGRATALAAMGGVQYVLVSGEAGTMVARWVSPERKHLVCALVAEEHQIGMAKYRITGQLGAIGAWLAGR